MQGATDFDVIQATRRWVEQVVVALNLCPFAKRELVKNRVRFVVGKAVDESALLNELAAELTLLNADESIETTLLIHPQVLQDFYQYNDFLGMADALLVQMNQGLTVTRPQPSAVTVHDARSKGDEVRQAFQGLLRLPWHLLGR